MSDRMNKMTFQPSVFETHVIRRHLNRHSTTETIITNPRRIAFVFKSSDEMALTGDTRCRLTLRVEKEDRTEYTLDLHGVNIVDVNFALETLMADNAAKHDNKG